jgi:hypothetical protein
MAFQIVDCLDPNVYDCQAVGGRCISIRFVVRQQDDEYVYMRHRESWIYMDPPPSSSGNDDATFCQDASFCMLHGLQFDLQTYSDPSAVSFRPVTVPDRYIHVRAAGIGPLLLYFSNDFIVWKFECSNGQDPVTSSHGLPRPPLECSSTTKSLRRRGWR